MFYQIKLNHWYYDNKEKSFHLGQEKEMFSYIKEHLKNNWVITCMRIINDKPFLTGRR